MSFDRINKSGFDDSAIHYNHRYEFDKLPLNTGLPNDGMKIMVQSTNYGEMQAVYLSDISYNAIHTNIANEFASIPEKLVVNDDDMILLEEITTREKRKARLGTLGVVGYVNELPVQPGVTVNWNVVPESTFIFNSVWSDDFRDSDGTLAKFSLGLSAENNKIVSLAEPTDATDAASKNYIDTKEIQTFPITSEPVIVNWGPNAGLNVGTIYIDFLRGQGGNTTIDLNDHLNCLGNSVYNIQEPINATDAASKNYIDTKEIQTFPIGTAATFDWGTDTTLNIKSLKVDRISRIDSNDRIYLDYKIDCQNSSYIYGVPSPNNDLDCANKLYVDERINKKAFYQNYTTQTSFSTKVLNNGDMTSNAILLCNNTSSTDVTLGQLDEHPGLPATRRFTIFFTQVGAAFIIRPPSSGGIIYYDGQVITGASYLVNTTDPEYTSVEFIAIEDGTTGGPKSWAITSSTQPLGVV